MKPIEQPKHVDVWMCLKRNASNGQFYLDTTTLSAEYGIGFYGTEKAAQQHQLINLMKDQRVEIFHLEFPI